MSPLRKTFIPFITSTVVFIGGEMSFGDFKDPFKFYLFTILGLMLISWAVAILFNMRRPRISAILTAEKWWVNDNFICFKILSREGKLHLVNKVVVKGYIPSKMRHGKGNKKAKYEYSIAGEDLSVGSHEKLFKAMGNFDLDHQRGFLYFKTFTFYFVEGGIAKLRYIYSERDGPVSFIKHWFVLLVYFFTNKIPGINYWKNQKQQ